MIQLTAQEFISALKGKPIEEGKKENPFLQGPCVVVKDVVVQDKVIIKDSEIINEFHEFPYQIIIESGEFRSSFIIDSGVFEKEFKICGEVAFNFGFTINWAVFEKSFFIDGGVFKEYPLQVTDGAFKGGFFVESGLFHTGIELLGGKYENLAINGFLDKTRFLLKYLRLSLTISFPVNIENIFDMGSLHIENSLILPNTLVAFRNIFVNEIEIIDFENNGRLIFSRINDSNTDKTKGLFMVNSFLGNTSFFNVPFHEFEYTMIDHCQLNQIQTYGHEIPDNISAFTKINDLPQYLQFIEDTLEGKRVKNAYHYKELGKIFNGLQIAMQRQGNKVMENKYYAAFQEARYWNLRYKKKNLIDWSLFISLYFHRTSSDYGQNWLRPIGWIIVLGLPLFYFYFLGSPKYVFTWPWKGDWSLFWVFLGKFAEFLWPTHKFDFMYKSSGGWQFLDILARIIIGFLIYQTIAAFRRMGRR